MKKKKRGDLKLTRDGKALLSGTIALLILLLLFFMSIKTFGVGAEAVLVGVYIFISITLWLSEMSDFQETNNWEVFDKNSVIGLSLIAVFAILFMLFVVVYLFIEELLDVIYERV